MPTSEYPVTFDVAYPDRSLNRLTSALRVFTVIPIAIVLASVSGGTYEASGQSGRTTAVAAGGLLFLRGENGAVALVEPSADGYREKGRFTPPEAPAKSSPMEKSWAYPVVANGKLYLRDHGTLWCYAVR